MRVPFIVEDRRHRAVPPMRVLRIGAAAKQGEDPQVV
jgi:hypothetical protein